MTDHRLPSPNDIAAYQERGWHVTPPIIPLELLDEIRSLVHEHQMRPVDRRLPSSVGHSDWAPKDGPGVRNSEFLTYQEPRFAALTLMPLIGHIAALLAGTDEIRLFDDQAVMKPPGTCGSTVGWHTDHSYWSTCTSEQMMTAWIPFEDSTEENGALMVVDGSHRWPDTQNLRYFNVRDLDRLGEQIGRDVPAGAVRRITIRKGQVEFHHARTVHASGDNRSDRPRLALAVHLQDAANEYRAATAADGREIVLADDRLARLTHDGRPDYRDPSVFPVLWSVRRVD